MRRISVTTIITDTEQTQGTEEGCRGRGHGESCMNVRRTKVLVKAGLIWSEINILAVDILRLYENVAFIRRVS